ncbi:MAG: DUF4215 domain-containing protein, partial [Nanoarchaeota archaeon]
MKTKAVLILGIMLLMVLPLVWAGTVTRLFSQNPTTPGNIIEVTLIITPTSGDNKLVITEYLPSGAVVSDAGGLNTAIAGQLKKVLLELPTVTSYKYKVVAPSTPGESVFSGTYILSGSTTSPIDGYKSLVVKSSSTPQVVCGNGILETLEECDDGNVVSGDGCSDKCAIICNDPDNTYASKPNTKNYILNPLQKSSFSTKTKVVGIFQTTGVVAQMEDSCIDGATLRESFCVKNNTFTYTSFKCASYLPGTVCQDGACIVAAPTTETNCGDGTDEDKDGLLDCADVLDCPDKQASCGVGKYC